MKRPLLAIVLLPLLLVASLGYLSWGFWQDRSREQWREEQVDLLNRGAVLMSRELGHIQQTLAYMDQVLGKYYRPDQFDDLERWQDGVASYFVRAAGLSDYISQIRWLTPEGLEAVRVNISGNQAEVVPKSALQDKSNRYYFLDGMAGDGESASFSPIDLNVERGSIVTPYEITVRASMKILDDAGSELGLLVVNYNLNYLFARLRAMQTATNTFEMIDSEGFWLLSQTPEIEWLHLYGDILSSFPNQYPSAWPSVAQSTTLHSITLSNGKPLTVLPSSIDEQPNSVPDYFFLSKVRLDVWSMHSQFMIFSVISISVIVYGLLLSITLLWWKNSEQKRAYMQALQHEKQQLEIAQSELQNNNKDLVTLQNELVEKGKLSSLGLMVAGVGHELNTPLGGVRLSLSSLEHLIKQIQSELSEQQATLFQNSLNLATQNLNRAVQVVAQFKRITENQMSPDSECFSVNAMFDDTLAPLKAVLKKHPKIKLERHCEPADEIVAAQGVISQVLQNLIMNALDHAFDSEQSGVITLSATCEEEYVIEVSDNGKGISEDIIDHIWEPFVTTERGIKQHSGLGLFMVHQWVTKLLKGRVTVHSEPGQTRFTLYLPIPESNEP